jgi:alcohol dehydrogenase (cytochrome c)
MLGASPGIKGQSDSVAPGDWITFNRTLAGSRFSPLSAINRENVTHLRPVCTYTLPEVVSLQTGPLVVDGTMYFTSDLGSYAIDADTCAERWRSVRNITKPNGLGAHRGFAYLDGSGEVRWKFQTPRPINAAVTPTAGGLLFTADLGGRFYAFDASSGQVLWQHELGQSTGGGIVTYLANGRQRVAIASGMKSPVWPGAADASQIIIFGAEAP